MKEGTIQTTKNDNIYIPKYRFNLFESNNKISDIVPGFPVNKQIKYDRNKMVKAIQNGMILLISYKGDKDKWRGGRERVIYPLVLGINKNTKNELIRGWHLEGYSVSQKRETKKVWRLFKAINIKYMMFTGNFYRLPPKGYKMNDRVMTEVSIAKADFNTIRKNQDKLIKAGQIENQEDITISKKNSYITTKIQITNTNTILDLKNPYNNTYIKELKKTPDKIKLTILKPIFSNEYIIVLGATGEPNKTIKIYEQKKLLGSFKVVKSFTGKEFKNNKIVKGMSEFKLYFFNKKI